MTTMNSYNCDRHTHCHIHPWLHTQTTPGGGGGDKIGNLTICWSNNNLVFFPRSWKKGGAASNYSGDHFTVANTRKFVRMDWYASKIDSIQMEYYRSTKTKLTVHNNKLTPDSSNAAILWSKWAMWVSRGRTAMITAHDRPFGLAHTSGRLEPRHIGR